MSDKKRQDEVIRLALEMKQKQEQGDVEREALADSGLDPGLMRRAEQEHKRRVEKRRKLIKSIAGAVGIIVLMILAALLTTLKD